MNYKKESQTPNNELVTKFRSLIRESDINFPMSDELLLCFIRARKNDLHRALKMLTNYVKMVKNYPELLTDLRHERMKPTLDLGHLLASPQREQNGRRVLILNARGWDASICSLEEAFRSFVYCFQRAIAEIETQINGVVLIMDFKGFTLRQAKQISPTIVKKIADLIQDVFPMRLLGIHVTHEPWVMKLVLALFWPFLSHKIRNRLFFHSDCFESLHQHVDPACLPSDYDGWLGPMDTMYFSNVLPEENYSKMFDCFD